MSIAKITLTIGVTTSLCLAQSASAENQLGGPAADHSKSVAPDTTGLKPSRVAGELRPSLNAVVAAKADAVPGVRNQLASEPTFNFAKVAVTRSAGAIAASTGLNKLSLAALAGDLPQASRLKGSFSPAPRDPSTLFAKGAPSGNILGTIEAAAPRDKSLNK